MIKRRDSLFTALIILLTFAVAAAAQVASWQKYIAPDGSFSFHYPKGWKIAVHKSIIEISNAATDEQILIIALPKEGRKDTLSVAKGALAVFKKDNPGLQAEQWVLAPGGRENMVLFQTTSTDLGRAYRGDVLVVNGDSQTQWISFNGPEAGYSRSRALTVLEGLVGSMKNGTGSLPPAPAPASPSDGARIDRNARAFMFVLTFALGAPLTVFDEMVISNELKRGWSGRTAAELAPYDAYPKLVQTILHVSQKDLGTLQKTLSETVREWLMNSDTSDPAVRAVRDQIDRGGRVLIPGEPALTEIAANAYSEIMAFSEMLGEDFEASPDRVDTSAVAEIRGRLMKAWKGFNRADREAVGTAPALWITYRSLLRFGEDADRRKIRSTIAGFMPASQSGTGSREGNFRGGAYALISSETLRMASRATFNSYLWSHGYSGYSAGGFRSW